MSPDPTGKETGRSSFPVSVILERRPPLDDRWVDHVWSAAGVTVGRRDAGNDGRPTLVRERDGVAHYMVNGLQVTLFPDECESYYHNMMTATPRCYVVVHREEADAMPEPFLVSMSFDEAHAYLEGEDEIFAVDVPPELYRWTEAFVIANYFPEKKTKRKLKDWTRSEDEGRPS
ncbi:MAG: DUF3305 domain-containing protein [Gammaproteobacteria bacterium]|jgi:hypothetical protein